MLAFPGFRNTSTWSLFPRAATVFGTDDTLDLQNSRHMPGSAAASRKTLLDAIRPRS